jgi:hypothetical protein
VSASVAPATSMKAATTVGASAPTESASTVAVKAAAAVGATTAAETTADVAADPAPGVAAAWSASIRVPWAIPVARPATVAAPVAVPGPPIIAATVIAATVEAATVEPRPSADKHSTHKVVRPVVAIRRAVIGVISVVSIRTNRCGAVCTVHRANRNAKPNLGLRVARAHQHNAQ